MVNILITGAIKLSDSFRSQIEELGLNIIYVQNELEVIPFDVSNIELIICNGLFLHNDITRFTSLKYIQITSAGFDRLPMKQIKERGIIVNNARGVYSVPMAEWALSCILAIYKNTKGFIENKRNKVWNKDRNVLELHSKSALVVGYGNVGREVAKRLFAMGVKVSAVDLYETQCEYVDKCYNICQLNDIVSTYDIIILTLPLTEETHYLFNDEMFTNMKDGVTLVNISRGAVINETALIKHIDNNKFRGVVLDVFETEPLPSQSLLWDCENVIITPHNSFVSECNLDRLEAVILNNLKKYIDEK